MIVPHTAQELDSLVRDTVAQAATVAKETVVAAPPRVVSGHRAGLHPLLLILLIPVFLIVCFYGSYVLPPVLAGGTFLVVTGVFFLALDSFLKDVPLGTVIALVIAIIAGFVLAQAVAGMAEPSTVILCAALGASLGLILEPVFRVFHVVREPSSFGTQMISIIAFFAIIFGYFGQFVNLGTAAFLSTSYVGACAAVESLRLLSTSFFSQAEVVGKHHVSSPEMMAKWFVFGATLILGTIGFVFQKYCFKRGQTEVDTREYEPIG